VRKFVYFCLSYGLYIFSNTLQDNWLRLIPNPSETIIAYADLVSYVAAIFGCLTAISCLVFFEHLLSPFFQKPKQISNAINNLLILFLFIFALTLKPVGWISNIHQTPPYFSIYAISILITFAYIYWIFWTSIRRQNPIPKSLLVVGGGWVTFSIGVSVTEVILPIYNILDWAWIGRLSGLVLATSMFVAITSYRLWNIRTAIHYTIYWGAIWTFGILALLVIPKAAVYTHLIPQDALITASLALIGVAGSTGLFFASLLPRINAILFRRRYELEKEVVVFQLQLSKLSTFGALADTLRQLLQRVLCASSVVVGIPSEPTGTWIFFKDGTTEVLCINELKLWFASPEIHHFPGHTRLMDTTPLIHVEPLEVQNEKVGLILLGEKYNLKPLTIDEISFLKAINPSLSISIKNSALFAALRTQNDEMGTLQHQLFSLQQDLLKTIQDQTLTSGAIHEFKNTHLAIGGLVQHFLDKSDIDINAVRRILAEFVIHEPWPRDPHPKRSF